MSETAWQPIETAPKDGTFVLLWLGPHWETAEVLQWSEEENAWIDRHHGALIGSLVPTHWQPLPTPPTAA